MVPLQANQGNIPGDLAQETGLSKPFALELLHGVYSIGKNSSSVSGSNRIRAYECFTEPGSE